MLYIFITLGVQISKILVVTAFVETKLIKPIYQSVSFDWSDNRLN